MSEIIKRFKISSNAIIAYFDTKLKTQINSNFDFVFARIHSKTFKMKFLHLAIVVVAFMANNSEAKCGSQNRNPRFNRPICSPGGLCMEIAESIYSSHVR